MAQAAHRLVMQLDPPCSLQGFAGDDIALLLPGEHGTGAIVVEHRADAADEQLKRVAKLRSQVRFPVVIAVLGGDEAAAQIARGDKPIITAAKQRWVHIADDGEVSGTAKDTEIARVLAANAQTPTDGEWAAFMDRAKAQAAAIDADLKQAQNFTRLRASNKPKVSIALLALMAVFFGLEQAFGGTASMFTLLRLGALSGQRVLEHGEVYRLLSVAFLHGDLLHLAVNGYVLYRLGSFLEQVIGSWRFVVLLILSVFGGSCASLLASPDVLAVGASGGLWGVLAGHAVLAWRPQGLLPEAMIRGARQAAVSNLVLNVFVSFMPNIDWAAHFGGGIGGGLLMLLVLRRGLPALKDQPPDEDPGPVPPPATWLRAAAVVLVVLQLGSGAAALALGQPWTLREPVWEETGSKKLGVLLELPTALKPGEDRGLPPFMQSFGDPKLGPTVCTLSVLREANTTLDALDALWRDAPDGTTLSGRPDRQQVGDAPGLVAVYAYQNGARSRRVLKLKDNVAFQATCVVLPALPTWERVADRLVETMRLDPNAL